MMKKLSFILLTIVGVLRPRRVKLTTVVTELIIAPVGTTAAVAAATTTAVEAAITAAVAIAIGGTVIGTASITTRATVRSSDGLRFRYQATRSNGSE